MLTPRSKSTLKAVATHAGEHYPSSPAYGVYPSADDTAVSLVIVGSKFSPANFWNGRWRSVYTFTPGTNTLAGELKVDVHYYEDGNVRLLTNKPVEHELSSGNAAEIVKVLAAEEKRYQEELNRAFGQLSEGAFKSLRRQLPITRQKIDWEKIGSYRLGQGTLPQVDDCGVVLMGRRGRRCDGEGAEVDGYIPKHFITRIVETPQERRECDDATRSTPTRSTAPPRPRSRSPPS